jgi:hypothetical protein
VVAHSHGGGVVLYSLRNQSVKKNLTGLICLSTPFLTSKKRQWTRLTHLGRVPLVIATSLAMFGLLVLGLCTLVGVIVGIIGICLGWSGDAMLDTFSVWLFLAFILTFLLLLPVLAMSIKKSFPIDLKFITNQKMVTFAKKQTAEGLRKIQIPKNIKTRVFAVTVTGDEALYWLKTLLSFADAPFWFFSVAWTIFTVSLVAVVPLWFIFFYTGIQDWPIYGVVVGCALAAAFLGVVSPALTFTLFPIILWLSVLLRSTPLATGEKPGWSSFFVKLIVQKNPEVKNFSHHHLTMSLGKVLRHSAVYEDPRTFKLISDWISHCLKNLAASKNPLEK